MTKADVGSLSIFLLTVVFAGLKLAGRFPFSWWWVLSPVWLPLAGALLYLCAMIAAFSVKAIWEAFREC